MSSDYTVRNEIRDMRETLEKQNNMIIFLLEMQLFTTTDMSIHDMRKIVDDKNKEESARHSAEMRVARERRDEMLAEKKAKEEASVIDEQKRKLESTKEEIKEITSKRDNL